ncbi:MAG: hypothetical protein A2293_03880 [Elusimicrobia bacterium RIFOXYB2_FULL_49_7]|nr:MAG: hypothetical protein A2293_03880 [Elusimicrobia bacterium RIFOXYB2_FULL_49_7]
MVMGLDIGSTWTKGALFSFSTDGPATLLTRLQIATPIENLYHGFSKIKKGLMCEVGTQPVPCYVTSSARGGLKVAAIGVVPDLTLSVAKQTVMNAGGKITASFSYKMTGFEKARLEEIQPDIIFLAGGTDGGNEAIILHNAQQLATLSSEGIILYAGNAKLQERVCRILNKKELRITENIMPEVGTLNLEPAREAIRDLFLSRLIDGKGLSVIQAEITGEVRPTPRAMLDLVEAMDRYCPEMGEFCLLDPGGATTDVYSCAVGTPNESGTILKGLTEPRIKRSVEGDLGLRVSAVPCVEAGNGYLAERMQEMELSKQDLDDWVTKATQHPEGLPETNEEKMADTLLAEVCVREAAGRHAGRMAETLTAQGKVILQRGKDLRSVRRVFLTGGYLSRLTEATLLHCAFNRLNTPLEEAPLWPAESEYYTDKDYLFPLLAAALPGNPKVCAATAIANARPL